MSMQALNWIKPKRVTVAQKCILWALADHANAAGECRLLLSTLSEETCLGRSALINGLKALARLGLIIKQPMQGRSTIYRLNLEAREPEQPLGDPESSRSPVHIVDPSPPAEVAPTRPHGGPPPSISWTPPVHMVDPEPSYESISKPEECVRPRKVKATRSVKTSLPPGFGISESVRAWASAKGFDRLGDHLESFCGKAAAKGYRYADWDAAFKVAIREDWAGVRSPKHQPRADAVSRCQQASEAWLREKEQAQASQQQPQPFSNVLQFGPLAARDQASPDDEWLANQNAARVRQINEKTAEAERLRLSQARGAEELKIMEAEVEARRRARFDRVQAGRAMA